MRSRLLDDYPLSVLGPFAALVAGAAVGVLADDLSAAYAAIVLITTVSLVWRVGDPVVLPFIMTLQWLSVTAGYWYSVAFGTFPGYYAPVNHERTMLIALTGLLFLAGGVRLGSQWFGRSRHLGEAVESADPQRAHLVWPLFAIVMVCYALDYVYTINARDFGGGASTIQRVLEFRQVLLITLWLEILRSRRHSWLLFASFMWAVAPRLGTYYSDFKSPVVLMLIVLAAAWRPWDARWWPRSLVALLKAAPFAAMLLVLLLIWQGGLKRDTRLAHDAGAIGPNPTERITFFVRNFRAELPELFKTPEPYVEALVERVSYITFLSHVLDRMPDREPYAGGELLRMALLNAFVPRFLVPDKPELPSDSYYTRRFAGVPVAEGTTSISIGYMAEFYADWGYRGMFASIFLYGCWIGLIAGLVRVWAAVPAMRFGTMVVVLLAVADFEHQFIKGFAGLNLNAIVMLGLLFVFRLPLSRLVRAEGPAARRPAAAAAEAPAP